MNELESLPSSGRIKPTLHDGRRVTGLNHGPCAEFITDHVSTSEKRPFQDVGIEYCRYAHEAA